MEKITACMKCGGRDLDAIFSAKGAFVGSYHCRECNNAGQALTFDDWESYEEFRRSLETGEG